MLLPDLNGQRAIVTGANSGLGFETAKALAGAGADVVVAVRNAAKGREAIASLRGAHPDARLELEDLDVSSLASVRSFADRQAGRGIDLVLGQTIRRLERAPDGIAATLSDGSVRIVDDSTVDIRPSIPNLRLLDQLTHPTNSIMAPGSDP